MRRILLGLLAIATTLTVFMITRAADEAAGEPEEHCLVSVLATLDDGQMILSEPVCSDGADGTAVAATGPGVGESAAAASTGTAYHFDGDGYSGSRLTVTGVSCTGTWYFLPPSWEDRVNSTLYVGTSCSRIRHYDWDAGRFRSTWPSGNLWSFSNRAQAIYYDY